MHAKGIDFNLISIYIYTRLVVHIGLELSM